MNYIGFGRPLFESVAATRIHHQWSPDRLFIGHPGLNPSVLDTLKKMGHFVESKEFNCSIQAIAFEKGKLYGVSDPRNEGMSYGE